VLAPTGLHGLLDTICAAAARLTGASVGRISERNGGMDRAVGYWGAGADKWREWRRMLEARGPGYAGQPFRGNTSS
jgi:hypothetical protein